MTLKQLYKDIYDIEITKDMTHQQTMDEFYKICIKHGIKQGIPLETGVRVCNTEEWNFYWIIFKERIQDTYTAFDFQIGIKIPKEIL